MQQRIVLLISIDEYIQCTYVEDVIVYDMKSIIHALVAYYTFIPVTFLKVSSPVEV